jgi:hypothetical protein
LGRFAVEQVFHGDYLHLGVASAVSWVLVEAAVVGRLDHARGWPVHADEDSHRCPLRLPVSP